MEFENNIRTPMFEVHDQNFNIDEIQIETLNIEEPSMLS